MNFGKAFKQYNASATMNKVTQHTAIEKFNSKIVKINFQNVLKRRIAVRNFASVGNRNNVGITISYFSFAYKICCRYIDYIIS